MRYTAYTLDGSVIFRAEDAQKLADGVFTHMQESRRPHIGYTYDESHSGRYMTWQLRDHLQGYPHKNFDEVADWWQNQNPNNLRKWHSGPPPSIGWWQASVARNERVWRWWDGSLWSIPAYPDYSAYQAAAAVARSRAKSHRHEKVLWNDYWPENARVERKAP